MLTRRNFLIGASSAAVAVGAGFVPTAAPAASYFSGRAIEARMQQGVAEFLYVIVHPSMMRDMLRERPNIVEEFRKSNVIMMEGIPMMIDNTDSIE